MVELASIRSRNGEKRWKIDIYSAENGLIMANGWKDICHTHFARFCRCVVDASTICRCTGRTDRDEKLIFEHDVIVYLDTYSTESGYAEADCAGEVVWDEETLSFQVTNRLSAESWEVLDGECKVLGNTIDNPELLEV